MGLLDAGQVVLADGWEGGLIRVRRLIGGRLNGRRQRLLLEGEPGALLLLLGALTLRPGPPHLRRRRMLLHGGAAVGLAANAQLAQPGADGLRLGIGGGGGGGGTADRPPHQWHHGVRHPVAAAVALGLFRCG